MVKEVVTYVDYNGIERTEELYFDFSRAEVLEMETGEVGGLSEKLKAIIAAKDLPEVMKVFKDLVLKAYGQKSADGRRFIKSEELRTEFSQTKAYSDLFMKLATNTEEAIKFVNGILPQENEAPATTPTVVK